MTLMSKIVISRDLKVISEYIIKKINTSLLNFENKMAAKCLRSYWNKPCGS